MFISVLLVDGWPECSLLLTKFSKCLNQENHSKICVISVALSSAAVLSISCISNAVCPSCQQTFMQLHCSAIRKSWITFNMNKNKHPPKGNAEGYGCKTHWTDSEGSDTIVPMAESCNICNSQSSSEFRNFWTFVLPSYSEIMTKIIK
jgi:hypothetical protein